MPSVLLRRVVQPNNCLSRFLAERSGDFGDGTTPDNHDPSLGPIHRPERVRPPAECSGKQRQPHRLGMWQKTREKFRYALNFG
jgi:hypothetical protein